MPISQRMEQKLFAQLQRYSANVTNPQPVIVPMPQHFYTPQLQTYVGCPNSPFLYMPDQEAHFQPKRRKSDYVRELIVKMEDLAFYEQCLVRPSSYMRDQILKLNIMISLWEMYQIRPEMSSCRLKTQRCRAHSTRTRHSAIYGKNQQRIR